MYKTIKTNLDIWIAPLSNAKKPNINKMQTFQNIAIRKLTNVPPYISNFTLHSDLKLKTINDEAKCFIKDFTIM